MPRKSWSSRSRSSRSSFFSGWTSRSRSFSLSCLLGTGGFLQLAASSRNVLSGSNDGGLVISDSGCTVSDYWKQRLDIPRTCERYYESLRKCQEKYGSRSSKCDYYSTGIEYYSCKDYRK